MYLIFYSLLYILIVYYEFVFDKTPGMQLDQLNI